MLPFVRSDLAQFSTYTPHPEAAAGTPALRVERDRLDTNESPFDLPPELKQKLAWLYQEEVEANRYPDGSHRPLKQAIAAYVSESSGFTVQDDHLSLGNGSDELIRALLIATCLQGQGAVLVAEPTFSMYAILAQTLGIPVVKIRRTEANFALDLEAAQAALETQQTPPIRVVFVVHPNSPTGNDLTAAEQAWLKSLPRDVLVVVDEAYFEFSQTTLVQEVQRRPNWVILRTLSKAFRLAAHRVGYAIATPELAAILEKVRLPYNLPTFSQAAALVALQNRSVLLQTIPETLAERTRLAQGLTQMTGLQVWPSAANFLYLRAATPADTQQLYQFLKVKGTSIRQTGGGLRITVGTESENTHTLDRIQLALTNGQTFDLGKP